MVFDILCTLLICVYRWYFVQEIVLCTLTKSLCSSTAHQKNRDEVLRIIVTDTQMQR